MLWLSLDPDWRKVVFLNRNKLYAIFLKYDWFGCTENSNFNVSCRNDFEQYDSEYLFECCSRNPIHTMEMNNYNRLQQGAHGSMSASFLYDAPRFLVYAMAVTFNIPSFIILSFLFSKKGRGYHRVLWMAITDGTEKCFLWHSVEDRWLAFSKFLLLYWYLSFLALRIRTRSFWLCFIVIWNIVACCVMDI